MKRIVIAPHVDDDVIGCGGILDEETLVFYCGVDANHRVSAGQRRTEAMRVALEAGNRLRFPINANVTNGVVTVEGYYTEREVNYYDLPSLKNDFEDLIKEQRPQEVFLPWPSYNQDHQTVYDAAMVALRPHDEIPFVPRLFLYEEPDCFWPRIGAVFTPTYFRKIDIERKIKLYELMTSQVRPMRSSEHLRALARVRGAACNQEYAEAYYILRWVE